MGVRLEVEPIAGHPVRAWWIRAVHQAHTKLHAGPDVRCPVLVMCSAASTLVKEWDDRLLRSDGVLNVRDICRYADALGRCVRRIRIEGGMHDLVLSAVPVRAEVYRELATWVRGYVP